MTRLSPTHLYVTIAMLLLMNYGQCEPVGQNKSQKIITVDWSSVENELREFADLLEQPDEETIRNAILQIGNEQNDILFAGKLNLFARKYLKTS